MIDTNRVIDQIRDAFHGIKFPGDAFLQGSHDGCEPYEVIAPFKGLDDWRVLDSAFLDAHSEALSFFSEAGFRFFLPAYLIADLHNQLQTAGPLFHLTHGFSDSSVELSTGTRVFFKKLGKYALVNPRRYGAMTFYDYTRFRLSVFAREEARAIVAYLEYKREADPEGHHKQEINAALESFWLDRAANAPEQRILVQHLEAEENYLKEISGKFEW